MRKKILSLFLFILFSATSYGQNSYVNSIHLKIWQGLEYDLNNLKDSIAFYSFAYEIKIRKVKDSTIVEQIKVNDSIASQVITNHDILKRINYISIMGKRKELTLTIPVALILRDYNSANDIEKKISIYDFGKRINKLFYVDGLPDVLDRFYFRPIIVFLSKRVYD